MPNYSGRSTNSYIKVYMVFEVCFFSWMRVRPIYIDLNMYNAFAGTHGMHVVGGVAMVCEAIHAEL